MGSFLSINQKKKIRKLASKKYRKVYSRFVAEGMKVVLEALRSSWDIEFICISDRVKDRAEIKGMVELAGRRNIPVLYSTGRDFEYMSEMETPEEVLAVCRISDYKGTGKGKLPLVYLDRISDPGNLGTIVRTAVWFGIDFIVTSPDTVDMFNPKVVRSSMGAFFRVGFRQNVHFDEIYREFSGLNPVVLISDTRGDDLENVRLEGENFIVVFGSESHGVDRGLFKYATRRITIPGCGAGESLNVGVACGIVLYELWKKLTDME